MGPGEQEHPLAAVRRADVGGADATPERIKPRGGQVREYAVQPSSAPAQGGNVLHDNQPWSGSKVAKGGHDVGPQSTAGAFLDADPPAGGGDVLTREPSDEHLDGLDVGPVHAGDVAEVGHAGQPS
jgi:hypothetical protein